MDRDLDPVGGQRWRLSKQMTGTSILSHRSARGKAQDRGENGTQGAWVLKGGEDRTLRKRGGRQGHRCNQELEPAKQMKQGLGRLSLGGQLGPVRHCNPGTGHLWVEW